jgi:hypothetical protein
MQIDSTVNRFHTAFRTSLGMGLTNALRRKAGKKQKKADCCAFEGAATRCGDDASRANARSGLQLEMMNGILNRFST